MNDSSPSSPRLKVAFCTDGIFPQSVGGMQRHSRLLVEALAATGQVDLVVLHPHPGEVLFPGLDHVREIPLPPLPGRKHYFLELYDYSKKVRDVLAGMPDHIVYSQGLSVWAGLAELAHRTIVNPHGLEPYQALGWKARLKTWPYRRVFDRIFRRSARTISLGGRLTDILRARMGGRGQLLVLPNATNPLPLPRESLLKTRQQPLTFLFVGRFAFNKGIDILLEAAQQLNAAGRQSEFAIDLCGKGPLFEQMQARYPLPNTRFRGFVTDEDLAAAYLEDQVFVLPTLFEGMPTVVLEAMARAMPVIVTDVGATLELVGPDNGLIIQKQDVADLKRAMEHFIDLGAAEFAALSGASLDKFQARFTWEAVAAAHLELFGKMSRELKNH